MFDDRTGSTVEQMLDSRTHEDEYIVSYVEQIVPSLRAQSLKQKHKLHLIFWSWYSVTYIPIPSQEIQPTANRPCALPFIDSHSSPPYPGNIYLLPSHSPGIVTLGYYSRVDSVF